MDSKAIKNPWLKHGLSVQWASTFIEPTSSGKILNETYIECDVEANATQAVKLEAGNRIHTGKQVERQRNKMENWPSFAPREENVKHIQNTF